MAESERPFSVADAEKVERALAHLISVAEGTTPGPWEVYEDHGLMSVRSAQGTPVCTDAEGDASWIAMMSPLVLIPIAAWLKDAAECIREHLDEVPALSSTLCANEQQAIAFADAFLASIP
jgi:hypothetical protein